MPGQIKESSIRAQKMLSLKATISENLSNTKSGAKSHNKVNQTKGGNGSGILFWLANQCQILQQQLMQPKELKKMTTNILPEKQVPKKSRLVPNAPWKGMNLQEWETHTEI